MEYYRLRSCSNCGGVRKGITQGLCATTEIRISQERDRENWGGAIGRGRRNERNGAVDAVRQKNSIEKTLFTAHNAKIASMRNEAESE